MFRSLSIPVVLAVAAIGAAVVSAPAQAQHGLHSHLGHSHTISFPGQRALTGAIQEVRLAHDDSHPSHIQSHVLAAMQQISIAQQLVRNPLAQREMGDAYTHLDEFLHHGSHRDLDLAAAHLQTALEVARPVVVHRPVVHRPVVRPAPVVVPVHPPVHHGHGGGISFGNGKFQVRIGF